MKWHRCGWLVTAPVFFLALFLFLSLSTPAHAMASERTRYTMKQVYSAALRLVRVDMNLEVTEKDPEVSYILFQYKTRESGKQKTRGSFEIVPQKGGSVLILVKLPQMPSYHENMLLNRLDKKLRDEYGEPPAGRSPRKRKGGNATPKRNRPRNKRKSRDRNGSH